MAPSKIGLFALVVLVPALAMAEKQATPAPATATTTVEVTPQSRLQQQMRGTDQQIVRRQADLAAPDAKAKPKGIDDTRLADRISPIGAQPATTKSFVQRSPFDSTFDLLRAEVAKTHKNAAGKMMVSFRVSKKGKVLEPMIIGFSSKTDKELEDFLSKITFDPSYGGQRVSTTLAFRNTRKARTKNKKRRRR